MSLDHRLTDLTALLHRIAVQYRACAFASSFGAEDMVLHDIIYRKHLCTTRLKMSRLGSWAIVQQAC